MINEIANAKRILTIAERVAEHNTDRANAYVAVANGWTRLAELENAKNSVKAFQEKRFN